MDEKSADFLDLTEQLYVSFLEDYPSRSVVIYEVTQWDEFIFTYYHGNKINPYNSILRTGYGCVPIEKSFLSFKLLLRFFT
jgi:hypothetical protein